MKKLISFAGLIIGLFVILLYIQKLFTKFLNGSQGLNASDFED